MYYGMDNHYEKSESEGIRHHTIVLQSLSLHEYLDSETVLDGQCLIQRLKPLASTQSMCSCHIMHTVRGVKSSSILRAKILHILDSEYIGGFLEMNNA